MQDITCHQFRTTLAYRRRSSIGPILSMGAVGECREKPEALLQAPDGPGLRHRDTGPGEFAPQFPSPGASETEAHLRRNPAKPT